MCKNYTITPKGDESKNKSIFASFGKRNTTQQKQYNTNTIQQRTIKANTKQTTNNTKKACNNTIQHENGKRKQTVQSVLCTHTKRRFI